MLSASAISGMVEKLPVSSSLRQRKQHVIALRRALPTSALTLIDSPCRRSWPWMAKEFLLQSLEGPPCLTTEI